MAFGHNQTLRGRIIINLRKDSAGLQEIRQINMHRHLARAGTGHPEVCLPLAVERDILTLLAAAGAARIRQHGRASNTDRQRLPSILRASPYSVENRLASSRACG